MEVFGLRFDPWSLLMALRQKVINMGVDCVEGELVGCQLEDKNYERFTDGHRSNSEQRIKSIEVRQWIACDLMVIALTFQRCILHACSVP